MKKNIYGLTFDMLCDAVSEAGFERYRGEQVFRYIHKHLPGTFNEVKGITPNLKMYLEKSFSLNMPQIVSVTESEQFDTSKFLFEIKEERNSFRIETVLISEDNRRTVCISTQVGCNVGCEFCATGKMGFQKNLSVSNIVMQIHKVKFLTGETPTNVVLMGMGEPFLNYSNMLDALKIVTDKRGLGISSRKITVSTVGFNGKIKRFADDVTSPGMEHVKNVKLALSLHSTDNGFREALIPISKKNKLQYIYEELIYFYRKTGNKITYEYIFFPGLNDSIHDVKRLEKLSRMIPCNINVIPFHPISFKLSDPLQELNSYSDKQISLSKVAINDFIADLRNRSVVVNLRSSSGVDINAACGQLAVVENQ